MCLEYQRAKMAERRPEVDVGRVHEPEEEEGSCLKNNPEIFPNETGGILDHTSWLDGRNIQRICVE